MLNYLKPSEVVDDEDCYICVWAWDETDFYATKVFHKFLYFHETLYEKS